MRMHNRSMRNKFVHIADQGDTPINEVWYVDKKGESRQLYPSNELLAASVQLDIAKGTLEWAYLVHALNAIAEQGSRACYAQLTFKDGLYTYWVNKAHSALFMATLSDTGLVTFASNSGVPVQDLQPGTVVQLKLMVPEHNGELVVEEGKYTQPLPWLAGTKVRTKTGKWGSKEVMRYSLRAVGVSSGTVYFDEYQHYIGHGKGWFKRFHTSELGYIAGDTGFYTETYGRVHVSGWQVRIDYPAIDVTLKLKIKSPTAQKN